MIHKTAIIYPGVVIEEDVEIGAYCIIGAPPEHLKHYKEESKGVIIRKGTILTGHVTIDGGIFEPTVIGEECFLMKGVHVGHDSVIGRKSIISAHACLAGHTFIGNNSNIGIGVNIHQFSLIGGGSMVGMGSNITKKSIVLPFHKVVGSPAKSIGINKNKYETLLNWEIQVINEQYRNAKDSGMFYNTESGKTK